MADTKITEKYSYLTDILTSYGGKEQRVKLRTVPNHLLSYNYNAMNSAEAQWLRAQIRQNQSVVTFIPMWHSMASIADNFLSGKILSIDERYMYGFHNCDAVEIFRKDDVMHHSSYNITKIVKRYEDNKIVFKTPIDKELDKLNTFVVPLIRCSTQPTSNIAYVYSNGSNLTMNFEDILYEPTFDIPSKYYTEFDYTDIDNFNNYSLPTSIDGLDVFLCEPQWTSDDSLTLSVGKLTNKLDNKTGIFKYDLKNNKTYDSHSMTILLENIKMIVNMKKFFNRVAGRFKSFYCPSWVNDLSPSADIAEGTNIIYTELNDLYRYYLTNGRKKKIIIFTKDFKSHIYDILTYGTETINNVKYGKILLSSPVDSNIPLINIEMISFMNLVRFDSDDLQIDYETTEVATVQLAMKEVDDI